MTSLTELNEALNRAPEFDIEVLTEAELDVVSGGLLSSAQFIGKSDSNTVSICSTDGNDEPGTA